MGERRQAEAKRALQNALVQRGLRILRAEDGATLRQGRPEPRGRGRVEQGVEALQRPGAFHVPRRRRPRDLLAEPGAEGGLKILSLGVASKPPHRPHVQRRRRGVSHAKTLHRRVEERSYDRMHPPSRRLDD